VAIYFTLSQKNDIIARLFRLFRQKSMSKFFTTVLGVLLLWGTVPYDTQAARFDFSPSNISSLRSGGITRQSHPYGTESSIQFNLFTDDTALSALRGHGNNVNSFSDERDFVSARKVGQQQYLHTVSGLGSGDRVRVFIYLHNNAEEGPSQNTAHGTSVQFDWGNPEELKGSISASNSIPQTINDIVSLRYNGNITLQPVGPVTIRSFNGSGFDTQTVTPSISGTRATVQLGSMKACYNFIRAVYMDFEIVPVAECGDSIIQSPEQCDDGNTIDGDGCSAICEVEPICGDGLINQENEQCDDGNNIDDDECSNECLQNPEGDPFCGDGAVNQPSEECDDGNNIDDDECSNLCLDNTTDPICGNGTIEPPEQCDDGNLVNGDGCSDTCRLPGGGPGSGGPETNPTIGTCSVNESTGALQCTPRYPYRDTSDPDYWAYKDCVRNSTALNAQALCLTEWALIKEFQVCGPGVPGVIDVPYTGSYNADFSQVPEIDNQCLPFEIGECQTCPSCFGAAQFIEKSVRDNQGNWTDYTTIAKGEKVDYRLKLTLGNYDNHNTRILEGKVKFYDFAIPRESGHIWGRDGILSDGWHWKSDGQHFEQTLPVSVIANMNSGGGAEFNLEYTMNSDLGLSDDSSVLTNVAFAVLEYKYAEETCDDEGSCHFEPQTDPKIIAISGDPGTDACELAQGATTLYSNSTLGGQAKVELIRPFIEAKQGGNIAFDFASHNAQKIIGINPEIQQTTSGKLFINEGASGLFQSASQLLKKVTDFAGLTKFDSQRDDYLHNLRQNAHATKSFSEGVFGNFRTHETGSEIYFLESPQLVLEGTFDAKNKSKTFIIEDGKSVLVSNSFTVKNGFVAFILRDSDLIIDHRIGQTQNDRVEGIFLVEDGAIRSNNLSEHQLRISGGLLGNARHLLQNRKFIGDQLDGSGKLKLEPSIKINFDLRLLDETPPALEQFLGQDWRESIE
jgi:cysteine-rich repeat protein